MDPRKSETPFRPSVDTIIVDQYLLAEPELDECLAIMNKPHALRTPQETETFVNKIASLEIFGRSILENFDTNTVVTKLMPFMKTEFFPAGKPIFHYEEPSDKMYIILRGKAKEFMAKGIDEIEEESHCKYGGFQYLQGVPISMPEIAKPETPPSASSHPQQKGACSSLNTICEENEEEGATSEATKKRLRKLKAVLPFLKKLNNQKNSAHSVEEYRYKRSIKKARSILKPTFSDEDINLEALERELGYFIVEEFKKYPKTYFIGGILKVRFSKYLYAGSHCGLRALRDNSLRSRAVFAEEDCYCLSLHRDDFAAVLENEKALNIDKINFFKRIFNMIEENSVIDFALLWESQCCKMNDVIFQQNDPSNYLYVLCSGEVMLTKTVSQQQKRKPFFAVDLPYRVKRKADPNEHTFRVATICKGDFFGEEDFFEEQCREFTATVTSTKAKVYKLPHEKYKNLCKNYSDIVKEIRKMMSLKTDWKKERLEGLYQHHSTLMQNKAEPKELRAEQEKNLIALGLLSPEIQSSSLRLKRKLIEKVTLTDSKTNEESSKMLKFRKNSSENLKSYKEEGLEATKENDRGLEPRLALQQSKLINLKATNYNSTGKPGTSGNEEVGLFSRARIPRHFEQKYDSILKQSSEIFSQNHEIVRLDLRDDEPVKKHNSKKYDSLGRDAEQKKSSSQSKEGGLVCTASLNIIKRKLMKKRAAGGAEIMSAIDIREFKEFKKRAPSMEIDSKWQSQDPVQNTSLAMNAAGQSLYEKSFKQTVFGQPVKSPVHTSKLLVTSLERFEKVSSLTTLESTTRQTGSKGFLDNGSLNKLGEEILGGRAKVGTSPMLHKSKQRPSVKIFRPTVGKRESCNSSQNGKENAGGHKSFRVQGEKATAQGLGSRKGEEGLKNIKSTSALNIRSQNHV